LKVAQAEAVDARRVIWVRFDLDHGSGDDPGVVAEERATEGGDEDEEPEVDTRSLLIK